MTSVCGGGTSGPKVGAAAVVDFNTGALAALLSRFSSPWMIPLIGLVGLAPLALSVFCATDPPPMQNLTQAEADALLQLSIGSPDFANGLSKLEGNLQHMIWYDQCQCTSGALVPLTPSPQPAGSITVITPPPPLVTPCRSVTDTSGHVLLGTENLTFIFSGQLPPGAGIARITAKDTLVAGGGTAFTFTWYQVDYSSAVIATDTFGPVTANNFAVRDVTLLPNCKELSMRATGDGGAGSSNTIGSTFDIYCGSDTPGAAQQPCCPPDTATQAQLDTILDLLMSMQRSYAPFAYNFGMTSSFLTGTGSLAVSRAIGMQVEMNAFLPPNTSPGNPPYRFDGGWVSISAGSHMLQERRISQDAFTWFPERMPIADSINYFAPPPLRISITPLYPEP